MQKVNKIRAIRRASRFLRDVENMASMYDEDLENSLNHTDNEDENQFFQFGRMMNEKHGCGGYIAALLLQQSLLTLLYFQGKIDEESFQEAKAMTANVLIELEQLTRSPENNYLH